MPTSTLLSLKQLAERYPALHERLLQHWIAINCDDFRGRCTLKVNRRRFIDAEEVAVWLDDHRGARASPDTRTAEG
jgi:hypothetical protein